VTATYLRFVTAVYRVADALRGSEKAPIEEVAMRRLVGIVVGVALIGGMSLTGIALAHTSSASPDLTIGHSPGGAVDPGDKVVVFGAVRGKALCKQRVQVTLFRVEPGRNARLGTDRTDNDGEYRFVLHPQSDQTVYTKIGKLVETSYGHSHTCRKARSENESINVT
jgi:hypothetical protein